MIDIFLCYELGQGFTLFRIIQRENISKVRAEHASNRTPSLLALITQARDDTLSSYRLQTCLIVTIYHLRKSIHHGVHSKPRWISPII